MKAKEAVPEIRDKKPAYAARSACKLACITAVPPNAIDATTSVAISREFCVQVYKAQKALIILPGIIKYILAAGPRISKNTSQDMHWPKSVG